MNKPFFAFLLLLVFSCSPDEETLTTTTTEPIFPIYLDVNGITIKAYDFAIVGNEYELNGETEISKIFPNEFFGYTKVTVEQPLIENGFVKTDKKGNAKADSKLRDYESIPLSESVEEYFEREVRPHLPDAWMERKKDKVGYEINFTKYFYEYKPLRAVEDILSDLAKLEEETKALTKDLFK